MACGIFNGLESKESGGQEFPLFGEVKKLWGYGSGRTGIWEQVLACGEGSWR